MLNSSSSSTSCSSSFSSSSSLISSSDFSKPFISSSSSSSSISYNPLPFNHHPPLQQPLPCHPTLQSPFPHYYHLHHLHAHPSLIPTHHIYAYPHVNSASHHHFPLPQASISADCLDTGGADHIDVYERLGNHNHIVHPHFEAPINRNISNSLINTNLSNIKHSDSVDFKCNTTDCSPRSVINRVRSSSSVPSPDSCLLSCYCNTNFSTNAGMPPATACPHQASNLSMTTSHHSPLHETNQGALLHVHEQLDHHRRPPRSPAAIHHHYYDVCSNFGSPSPHSGHSNYEAGTEKIYKGSEMRKNCKAVERRSSRSADLHKQREMEHCKSGYFSGSAMEDKPCMMTSNERAGYGSIKQRKQATVASRTREQGNLNADVSKSTAAKPMFKSMSNSMQSENGQKPQEERSFSCDSRSSKYNTECASCITRVHRSDEMREAGSVIYKMNEVAPRSPDALYNYGNGVASIDSDGNGKVRTQLGSKWEDAEKWVRPANHDQYGLGCRGFSNLSLLRMSNCVNAGTAVKSQHTRHSRDGPVHPSMLSAHDCNSDYSSDFASSDCVNYRPNGSHSARLYAAQESIVKQPCLARQAVHVDCLKPHLTCSNPNLAHVKPFSPYPQFSADRYITEHMLKQSTGEEQNLQGNYTQVSRQRHCASSSGSGSSVAPRDNQCVNVPHCGLESQASNNEVSACGSGWDVLPLPHYHCSPHHLMTDRFASGEIMSCASTSYLGHNDENLLIMPTMRGNVPMSVVSLREAGTQMSSVDGSGSISRFTSKNGSPQKPISPARHNTPAYMRSLNGSTNSISNMKEGGKKAIDLEELVECHRAKLELQALSDGERIHSFHRTTSNWSSREMEEEDLSRSLRHSTNLDEPHTSKNHPWPSQSYSWDKDDDSKLAKLLFKEAKIQAWEDKKKSRAEAQLKRLEESLAKKRSQTTNKIMGDLGAAQRKAEEMRASVHAQHRRPTKKPHRFRHRSLSPLSRCICFSPLH